MQTSYDERGMESLARDIAPPLPVIHVCMDAPPGVRAVRGVNPHTGQLHFAVTPQAAKLVTYFLRVRGRDDRYSVREVPGRTAVIFMDGPTAMAAGAIPDLPLPAARELHLTP